MAKLQYDEHFRMLKVDLHGCSVANCKTIIPTKLDEAYKFNLRLIHLVYGRSKHRLREAVFTTLSSQPSKNLIQSKCFVSIEQSTLAPTTQGSDYDTGVILQLSDNPSADWRIGTARFSSFVADYDEKKQIPELYLGNGEGRCHTFATTKLECMLKNLTIREIPDEERAYRFKTLDQMLSSVKMFEEPGVRSSIGEYLDWKKKPKQSE